MAHEVASRTDLLLSAWTVAEVEFQVLKLWQYRPILVVNKADRYTEDEQRQLQYLRTRLKG